MTTHPHRRWTNQPIVREVDRHRARWLWGLVLGMFVAAAPAILYILQQNECVRLSYELTELSSRHKQLEEELRRLRSRRAELESLDTIEDWALRGHGMQRPLPEQVVIVGVTPSDQGELVAGRGSRK